MNTASTPQSASPARTILKKLQDTFPVFRNFNPLAIGIDKQILARLPELNRGELRAAMGMHTKSTPYLRQVTKAKERFDLDGNVASEVTEAQRTHASTILKERAARSAEQRTLKLEMERKALREAEEAEAARKQAEKLNQLVAKFSRSGN
jgi:ProP effector